MPANPLSPEQQRQAELDFVPPEVAVGEPGVVWFPHAETSHEPSPCVVNETNKGVLTLTVFQKHGMPVTKTGVRHVDDPFHKTHRQDHVTRLGGWDFYCPALKQTKFTKAKAERVKQEKIKEAELAARKAAEKAIREEEAKAAREEEEAAKHADKKLVGAK